MRRFLVIILLSALLLSGCSSFIGDSPTNDSQQVRYVAEVEFPVGTIKKYEIEDFYRMHSGLIRLKLKNGEYIYTNESRVVLYEFKPGN